MKRIDLVLFAGTTEGRKLAESLAGAGVGVLTCVATAYGGDLMQPHDNIEVRQGRLNAGEISALLKEAGARLVVDATHPYAQEVSANIRQACEAVGDIRYLRLVRAGWEAKDVVCAADAAAAAAILAKEGGCALLTVGSKELAAFTAVPGYQQRLFARVLPSAQVVETCNDLGFTGKQLICMQGPFSHELNVAMLRQLRAEWLVTKDSGEAGGFYEKLSAARESGAKLLLIRRPVQEDGLPYEEMLALLYREFSCEVQQQTQRFYPRLPLFVDLAGKTVVVVGAGKIAARRIATLLACGATVTVIAPQAIEQVAAWAGTGRVTWRKNCYEDGMLEKEKPVLVLAATNDRDTNRRVGRKALALGIPCSVADAPEEGSFWFPALVQKKNLVAGVVSTDGDHRAVRSSARWLRQNWEETT